MPPLARRYFKTAIAFLVLGLLTGLHMSSALHLEAGVMHSYYVSAHTHVLLVGFLLMTIMGAAVWKLPDPSQPADARPSWALCAYWGITLGTASRYAAEVAVGYRDARWLHVAAFTASCAQSRPSCSSRGPSGRGCDVDQGPSASASSFQACASSSSPKRR